MFCIRQKINDFQESLVVLFHRHTHNR
jgi:hypothetical protein